MPLRLHLLMVVFVGAKLSFTMVQDHTGWPWVAAVLAAMVAVVLGREIVRLALARRAADPDDRSADGVTLWPLGALSGGVGSEAPTRACELRQMGAVLALQAAVAVAIGWTIFRATGAWTAAVPAPFGMRGSIGTLLLTDGTQPTWLIGLWAVQAANLAVLAVNALVPMLPLDAGVALSAWVGRGRAAVVGLIAACVLAAAGVAMGVAEMVGVAAVGGAICLAERRKAQFAADPLAEVPLLEPAGEEPEPAGMPSAAEVDRVLEKISATGMGSLSGTERRILDRAATRVASGGDGGSGPVREDL